MSYQSGTPIARQSPARFRTDSLHRDAVIQDGQGDLTDTERGLPSALDPPQLTRNGAGFRSFD